MKKIDELGISPTPWMTWHSNRKRVKDGRAFAIADCDYENLEDVANARLISSAPELYEALRNMQECFDYIRSTAWFMDANFSSIQKMTKAQNEARSALAKASGEDATE